MLDLRAISRDPDPALRALARRGDGSDQRLRDALALRERLNALIPERDEARAARNAGSQAIAEAKRSGADAGEAIAQMQAVSARVKELEPEITRLEEELAMLQTTLPNPPDPSAADTDNVLRTWGNGAASGRDHLELAGAMIDMEAGAKVAGSRFAFLKGDLVFLELALVRWTLELLRGHGFEPVIPPVLVREEALFGTGFLPDTEQQIYRLADDPLYLTGTSEVPLASLHAGEIMDEVPRRYAGFSPCFRREAGAAGKDTRGIFRVHQFDKVEMFAFVEPDDAPAEHERLLAIEEEILQGLGIPYQVVNIAVDDLGSSAAKKYDLEAWLPSQQRFRELTSTSNTTDFQSRRLDIRYRTESGKPAHVHTLNGTAVAVGRTLIALLENHQTADGGVEIPDVLREWARLRGWVDLEGAVNVRDLGGLPVEGGGVTAPGVLIRADNLQALSAADVAGLVDELGVRVVVDLRSGAEVELEGDGPLVGRVDIRHRSLYPEKGTMSDVMISRSDGEDPFVRYYLAYLRDRPDSFVGALDDIASGPGPVVVHCAAGKDRTGMVVALALSAVGVERDAIVADYVATGERIGAIMARLRGSDTYRRDLEDVTDESRMPRAEYLERVLEVLDERHGGAAGWLASHGYDLRAT